MTDWNRIQGVVVTSNPNNVFPLTVTNGSGVVGGVLLDTGFTLTNVTDDMGNSYIIFDEHDDGVLYTTAFKSNGFLTNGPKTLTFTHSAGSPSNWWIVQDEFQPPTLATAFNLDGSSTTFNSGGLSFASFNTSLPDDLVYAVCMSSGTASHGAGFNIGTGDPGPRVSEWGIQTSPGTVTMNLASQSGSFWGPAFAINGGGAPPAAATPFGVLGLASNEW